MRPRFVALSAALLMLSAKSVSAQQRPPWALGGALQLAPLESYPRFALGLEVTRALGKHFRVGAELGFYLPRHHGDVTRTAFAVNGVVQYSLVSGARVRWYVLGGVGVALFRDRYDARSAYADETALGPGISLGTGLDLHLGERISLFLEPRATSYRTRAVVDDEWLEGRLGARWHAL